MSRVHDALRRAEQSGLLSPPVNRAGGRSARAGAMVADPGPNLAGLLEQVQEVPFRAGDGFAADRHHAPA